MMQAQLDRSLAAMGGCQQVPAGGAAGSRGTSLRQLVIVNAWNEWGEQAMLEPTAEDGDMMLRAHRRAVEAVEARLAWYGGGADPTHT